MDFVVGVMNETFQDEVRKKRGVTIRLDLPKHTKTFWHNFVYSVSILFIIQFISPSLYSVVTVRRS